ncbi:plasmid stabilization system protein, RelE/ParE family [Selenomonas sp. FOBRC6]|jgi:plasmid stabilization system protein|nr:plasmid stabilization system protein, RelE/ParE family [Selenomonas sp. FOBRC6]
MRSIYAWIGKNLEECSNPRLHGKGLTANRSGQWRYRVNDYRLIAEIQDDVVVILIVRIAHRREVYD